MKNTELNIFQVHQLKLIKKVNIDSISVMIYSCLYSICTPQSVSSLNLSVYHSLNFRDHLQVITIFTCVSTFPQQHYPSITDCNLTLFNLLYHSNFNLENTQWKPRIPLFILKAISGKYAGLAIQNYNWEICT